MDGHLGMHPGHHHTVCTAPTALSLGAPMYTRRRRYHECTLRTVFREGRAGIFGRVLGVQGRFNGVLGRFKALTRAQVRFSRLVYGTCRRSRSRRNPRGHQRLDRAASDLPLFQEQLDLGSDISWFLDVSGHFVDAGVRCRECSSTRGFVIASVRRRTGSDQSC